MSTGLLEEGVDARLHPRLHRVITGLDENNQSIVTLEGPPGAIYQWPDGGGLYEIWGDACGPLNRHARVDQAQGPVRLCPPEGAVKVRWFTVMPPPVPPAARAEVERVVKEGFAAIGASEARPDTRLHPAMHLTRTLDAIIIVRGKVRLQLDSGERLLGPGDVVVQRGTNHAWICEGDEPALLVAVLLSRSFDSAAPRAEIEGANP